MNNDDLAAAILAEIRRVMPDYTFESPGDVVDFIGSDFVRDRVAIVLAATEAERAEAQPVWSPT